MEPLQPRRYSTTSTPSSRLHGFTPIVEHTRLKARPSLLNVLECVADIAEGDSSEAATAHEVLDAFAHPASYSLLSAFAEDTTAIGALPFEEVAVIMAENRVPVTCEVAREDEADDSNADA